MKNLVSNRVKLLGMLALLVVPAAHAAWLITNYTDAPIHIRADYHGYVPGFSCRPDEFWIAPGSSVKKHTWCMLKSLTSANGAGALRNLDGGSRFKIIKDGSGYWIQKD